MALAALPRSKLFSSVGNSTAGCCEPLTASSNNSWTNERTNEQTNERTNERKLKKCTGFHGCWLRDRYVLCPAPCIGQVSDIVTRTIPPSLLPFLRSDWPNSLKPPYITHAFASFLSLQHSLQTNESPWRRTQYVPPKRRNISLIHNAETLKKTTKRYTFSLRISLCAVPVRMVPGSPLQDCGVGVGRNFKWSRSR
jgi:hypothetical protein